jgi:hypothetical protein
MAVLTKARPDLEPYRRNTQLTFPEIVTELQQLIGRKLTAYIAGVKQTRALDGWVNGKEPNRDVEPRLRLAYQVAATLNESDNAPVIQAWFIGLNPELEDRSPAKMLREGSIDQNGPHVLDAARAYVASG